MFVWISIWRITSLLTGDAVRYYREQCNYYYNNDSFLGAIRIIPSK